MQPLDNKQGEHAWINLKTGQVIKLYNEKDRTFTNVFIKAVEAIVAELVNKNAKKRKNKVLLSTVDWIAGVEHDYEFNNNNYHYKNKKYNKYEE